MKTTPYTDLHIKLGAKMAEFAGYNMPIQYTGLVEEHNNVRNNVGVFDVSHMGEFRAKVGIWPSVCAIIHLSGISLPSMKRMP